MTSWLLTWGPIVIPAASLVGLVILGITNNPPPRP